MAVRDEYCPKCGSELIRTWKFDHFGSGDGEPRFKLHQRCPCKKHRWDKHYSGWESDCAFDSTWTKKDYEKDDIPDHDVYDYPKVGCGQ